MTFIKYNEKYFNSIVEVYYNTFSKAPWNEEWKDLETLGNFISDIINTPGFRGYLVCDEDRIIGYALGRVVRWWRGEDFYLENFCILPSYQNQGVGTRLFDFMKESLLSENIIHMTLLSDSDKPSFNFYKKNGLESDDYVRCMHRFLN